MAKLLEQTVADRPDDVALVDPAGSTTWAELGERVDRLIDGLSRAGIGPGDTLALMIGNRSEAFEVFWAAAHLGFTYVPVNWHWVADELAYVHRRRGTPGHAASSATGSPAIAEECPRRPDRAAGRRARAGPTAPAPSAGDRPRVLRRALLAEAPPTDDDAPSSCWAARCSTPRAPPVGPRAYGARWLGGPEGTPAEMHAARVSAGAWPSTCPCRRHHPAVPVPPTTRPNGR